MTTRELANLVLKLIGLLWVVGTLASSPMLYEVRAGGHTAMDSALFASAVLRFALQFVAGLVFYLGSERIAAALFPSTAPLSIAASAPELQAVAFGTLGMWMFATSLASVCSMLYLTTKRESLLGDSGMEQVWYTNRQQLVSAAVHMVIGLALFLGRNGLAGLWRKIHPGIAVEGE